MEETANPNPVYCVGIDTGNRCVKTASQVILSGISHSAEKSALFGSSETIFYEGMYYTLTSDRRPYDRNKTVDDDYFVLSLFALVRELKHRGVDVKSNPNPIHVALAVGLPPTHYNTLKNSFSQYFNRGLVSFTYNGEQVMLWIESVDVYVQGFSAIYGKIEEIARYNNAYIVDIGGYTTDIFELRKGTPNVDACYTLEAGMIHLYNDISGKFDAKCGVSLKENQIEDMLADTGYTLGIPGDQKYISDLARDYVDKLLKRVRERGVNLKLCKGVFTGGGAIRLQNCIKQSALVSDPIVIEDICANAKGYELIANYCSNRE